MKIRELTNIEKLSTVCHDYFSAHSVVCFRVRLTGEVNELFVKQALNKVQDANILLQACIRQEKFKLFFYKTPQFLPIPLIILEKTHDESWKDLSCREIQKKFDTINGPLARLFLLKSTDAHSHDLLLVAHHAIIDTKSAILFFDNLMQNYISYIEPKQNQLKVQTNVEVASKNYYELNIRERMKTKQILDNIGHFILNEDMTSALIAKCRVNNTSVFGMLAAACFTIIQTEVGYKKPFPAIVPVDMRQRHIPAISDKEFGCYMSIYKGLVFDPRRKNQFWELARQYKNSLNDAIKNHSVLEVYYPKNIILKVVLIALYKVKVFFEFFSRDNTGLLVINNVGKYALSSNFLSIEEFNWFANVTMMKRNRFFLNAITINGRLCVTLRSSFKNINSQVMAQKFLKLVEKVSNDENTFC